MSSSSSTSSSPPPPPSSPLRNFGDRVRITAKKLISTLSKQRDAELAATAKHKQSPMIKGHHQSTTLPLVMNNPQPSSNTADRSKHVNTSNALDQSYSYDPLAKYREDVILHHLNLVDKAGLGCNTSVTHVH